MMTQRNGKDQVLVQGQDLLIIIIMNQAIHKCLLFFSPPQVPGRPPYTQASSSSSGPPSNPPPAFLPQQSPSLYMIDPGAIRPCTFQFVYLWLEDGRSFWAWLTFVGRRSVAGWRWFGNRWIYFGTDIDNISSFVCY